MNMSLVIMVMADFVIFFGSWLLDFGTVMGNEWKCMDMNGNEEFEIAIGIDQNPSNSSWSRHFGTSLHGPMGGVCARRAQWAPIQEPGLEEAWSTLAQDMV